MILVESMTIPYVRIQKIFTHQNNFGEELHWLLVKLFDWVDPLSPLDPNTCAPYIKMKEFSIISISQAGEIVQDIQDPLSYEIFWINCWLNFGKNKYPINHLDELIVKYWK